MCHTHRRFTESRKVILSASIRVSTLSITITPGKERIKSGIKTNNTYDTQQRHFELICLIGAIHKNNRRILTSKDYRFIVYKEKSLSFLQQFSTVALKVDEQSDVLTDYYRNYDCNCHCELPDAIDYYVK
ncbi:4884_t:CDS:2 [Cetraspora pellucida]|uniref:4884_t:CDS:1 n=1 Tax=Cetraspora pellucida TaxID=1433469 RepID=A0A9N9FJX3_9GLOM|nr:4884_t:CDS:2 [Cetraspora pellucida]